MTAPIRWPAEAVWEAVAPLLPGFTVEVLPSIDSTNTELMRRARAGQTEPTLLVAEQQTAGRGRLGRVWQSDVGASLMLSLGLPMAPRDWSGLSLAVGVSVAESLQPTLPPLEPGQPPRIGLKWPNDLWLSGDRKLGGILVETASFVAPQAVHPAPAHGTAARYVVVGIGINVLPRSGEGMSMPPGSLDGTRVVGEEKLTIGRRVRDVRQGPDGHLYLLTDEDDGALLRIVPPLVAMLQGFEACGFAPVQPRFAARDVLQGRPVTLSDGQTGTAHGVGEDGALLVHTAQGMQAVTSAEISVRPAVLSTL